MKSMGVRVTNGLLVMAAVNAVFLAAGMVVTVCVFGLQAMLKALRDVFPVLCAMTASSVVATGVFALWPRSHKTLVVEPEPDISPHPVVALDVGRRCKDCLHFSFYPARGPCQDCVISHAPNWESKALDPREKKPHAPCSCSTCRHLAGPCKTCVELQAPHWEPKC